MSPAVRKDSSTAAPAENCNRTTRNEPDPKADAQPKLPPIRFRLPNTRQNDDEAAEAQDEAQDEAPDKTQVEGYEKDTEHNAQFVQPCHPLEEHPLGDVGIHLFLRVYIFEGAEESDASLWKEEQDFMDGKDFELDLERVKDDSWKLADDYAIEHTGTVDLKSVILVGKPVTTRKTGTLNTLRREFNAQHRYLGYNSEEMADAPSQALGAVI